MGKKGRARKAQRRKNKQNKKEMKNMTKAPSNYKTTTETTWATPSKANCHTGQNLIFTTSTGIDVYGGGRNRAGGWWAAPVTVDLAIGPDETMAPFNKAILQGGTLVPTGWSCEEFTGGIDPPKYMIEMDFPDFGVPQFQDLFWYALCDDIYEHGIKTVSTQCAGGHGRTGVQLCILYYLLNDADVKATIADAGQLIDLIRELHCEHAVETVGQQKYIARVCDIPVGESKIVEKSFGGYWGSDTGKAITTPPSHGGKKETTIGVYDLNEKYTMTADEDGTDLEECECCGEFEFDPLTRLCGYCGWLSPDPTDKEMLCMACGKNKPVFDYLSEGDDICITCLADEMKIKYTENKVMCDPCKKMVYTDMVAEVSDGAFVCMACEVKQ